MCMLDVHAYLLRLSLSIRGISNPLCTSYARLPLSSTVFQSLDEIDEDVSDPKSPVGLNFSPAPSAPL